ncbi:hypothetical protein TanjilG_32745 [Lupinus angustifolius]|uniref:Uncharacterized protein n=1 Tax=Lupinus angustifolius TaxID=3871 RepID=A0A4P1RFW1_LUPAN|nr:hypothetical protein TanjilG_32745 [Lupinus angustifolius]
MNMKVMYPKDAIYMSTHYGRGEAALALSNFAIPYLFTISDNLSFSSYKVIHKLSIMRLKVHVQAAPRAIAGKPSARFGQPSLGCPNNHESGLYALRGLQP